MAVTLVRLRYEVPLTRGRRGRPLSSIRSKSDLIYQKLGLNNPNITEIGLINPNRLKLGLVRSKLGL